MQYPPPLLFPIGVRRPRAPPPTTPTHTLYVRNLNEQVNPKSKSQSLNLEMIKALESLFSSFGKILDVKAKRNIPHRGQAFISYSSQEIADKVMKELQGYDLFGKKIDIQYAREESFAVSKEFGSLEEHKRKREDLKAKRGPKEKKIRTDESMAHPNSILFVQHLPVDISGDFLESLFRGFTGFKEVRMVPGKPDIAFIEYENEGFAAVAKKTLHGYRISPQVEIKVSFAKK